MPETLDAAAVDAGEVEQVANLAQSLPQGSAVAIWLQSQVVALGKGQDLAMFQVEEHVSPNQAAEVLHMSRPHLLKFIRSGELTTVQVGTHQRIAMSDLMDFIDRRERAKAAVAVAYGSSDPVDDALRNGAGTLSDEDVAALNAL